MQARHHVSFSEGDADLLLVSPSSRDVLDSKSSFTNDSESRKREGGAVTKMEAVWERLTLNNVQYTGC